MAQHMYIKKLKRFSSANRVSQILSTSGKGNSCERSKVIHLKQERTYHTTKQQFQVSVYSK